MCQGRVCSKDSTSMVLGRSSLICDEGRGKAHVSTAHMVVSLTRLNLRLIRAAI